MDSAKLLVVDTVRRVRTRWSSNKYTWPIDVSRELNCSWREAMLALMVADAHGLPISKRDDGRWYYDTRKERSQPVSFEFAGKS